MRKYSENERAPCAKIRGRGRAPKITKNVFGCDFLNYNLRLSIRLFLNRKIFLRADASSSGHFFREWCWSLTQKFYHYRIGDPTVLSGGWLGVRQVNLAFFFFFCIHRFGSPLKSERSRSQHLSTSESLRFCLFPSLSGCGVS
jgi:hypothetical protein